MAEDDFEIDKILLTPISDMISTIGDSIVTAATALNQHQVDAMQSYPQNLLDMGVLPTFYHMQEVEVELKMALHIVETSSDEKTEKKKRGWFSTPINSTYTNAAQFESSGSSSVRMTFAPAPPPAGFENGIEEPKPDEPKTSFTKPGKKNGEG